MYGCNYSQKLYIYFWPCSHCPHLYIIHVYLMVCTPPQPTDVNQDRLRIIGGIQSLVGAFRGFLPPTTLTPSQPHRSTPAQLELLVQIMKTLFAAALGNGELLVV